MQGQRIGKRLIASVITAAAATAAISVASVASVDRQTGTDLPGMTSAAVATATTTPAPDDTHWG